MQGEAKQKSRMRVKPFVKFVNFNHIMPTRYNLDVSDKLTKFLADETLADVRACRYVLSASVASSSDLLPAG